MMKSGRMVMSWGVVCAILAVAPLAADGQFVSGQSYILQAHLTGKTAAEGKVQFRLKDYAYRDFQLYIVNAEPGEMMVVAVRRGRDALRFAWVRVNEQGIAELFLSSNGKIRIPVLRKNDMIEIWSEKKGMMMRGEMHH